MNPHAFEDQIFFTVGMAIVCLVIYGTIWLFLNFGRRGKPPAAVVLPQREVLIGRFPATFVTCMALMLCWSLAHRLRSEPYVMQVLFSCLSFGIAEMLVDHWISKWKKAKAVRDSNAETADKD